MIWVMSKAWAVVIYLRGKVEPKVRSHVEDEDTVRAWDGHDLCALCFVAQVGSSHGQSAHKGQGGLLTLSGHCHSTRTRFS